MGPRKSVNQNRRGRSQTKIVAENDESQDSTALLPHSPRRGRGRPPTKKDNIQTTITCISLPVTEKDDEVVQCKLCGNKTTQREFRIHNMSMHSNIATTIDDPTIPEHKFYERRLKELAKFTKTKTFRCPTHNCTSSYKSTLGLAYHLELCGKTQEEIKKCLVQCDQCEQKFTLPNLAWHKKTHVTPSQNSGTSNKTTTQEITAKLTKRKSAIKARETFLRDATENENLPENEHDQLRKPKRKQTKTQDDEWDASQMAFDIEFQSAKSATKRNSHNNAAIPKKSTSVPTQKREFQASASKFLTSGLYNTTDKYWDKMKRIVQDPFCSLTTQNDWEQLDTFDLAEYLPKQIESVAFKTLVETVSRPELDVQVSSEYRRLPIFNGELVDDQLGHFIFNTGGPILGLSWHPSGDFLAVSTGGHMKEDIDLKLCCTRKSIIQIYSHYYHCDKTNVKPPINMLMPQIAICSNYGYATNIQWANYWPVCWDTYSKEDFEFPHTIGRTQNTRIGHLACSFEDGTIRIYFLTVQDCMMPRNFSIKDSSLKIQLYKKVPEICLELDSTQYSNVGQVCKFDWHEDNRFVIAGYCSGLVAIFDLETTSKLLRETRIENAQTTIVFNPFWVFQAHLAPVTAVHFDPTAPRYFVTASKDRYLKVWDLHMRQEIESRKIGLVLDTCWIRGWIHLAVASDAAISNLSSQYNFVRFYQIGSTQGRPNCAEFMDISSISFQNGITIQATENGNVTATYFDNFWREADYDRNKKKHNMVNLCRIELDTSSLKKITKDDFPKDDFRYAPFTFDPMEETKIILTFFRQRLRSQTINDPDKHYFENYVRFFPYLRINKLSWSPHGNCFATGYRNGLLTIVPASFSLLYDN